MSIDFSPPSYRAASSDLTISISPLGLVELADEEFEVHGPRLNRYSLNWAMYLGHHTSYRRQAGETQMIFNYYRALTDYIINFSFSKGVHFSSPKQTDGIVPNLLSRVWEVDNDKGTVLWEMGQQGSVSGDCFVKIAYEEAYQDSIGRMHPGKVRVLPLNASFCFPEFHPHDRERLIRFKLKYRFWGTSLEGTRQVFTYTEILTEDIIEEYINDELIDSRPNPLGIIPIVHIPNVRVSGSPWGLADCYDIIPLNRTYNEVSTDIADIINYHAAPVTVITGAKASQLEKGANKVWGGLPKDAKVQNLEGGGNGLKGAMEFLALIKRSMHEMVGIPETALGTTQPISNTSGVALSILFQPMMNKWNQKTTQYSRGIQRINEIILLNLAIKEPEAMQWNPTVEGELELGEAQVLDINDPLTYQNYVHFVPPLPLDKLIVLNEIQTKMSLGLESKAGALRAMGEEFPHEKLDEIRMELLADAKADGAVKLVQTQIENTIASLTGMLSGGLNGQPVPVGEAGGAPAGQEGAPPMMAPPIVDGALIASEQAEQQLRIDLVTKAYGTQLPNRAVPSEEI